MSTIKTHLTSHRDVAMVVFVAAVFVLAVVYSVFSATTISDNIDTGGTLTVSGNSSVAKVSSSSNIYASSTLQATGNILGYSNLGVGTTTPGTKLAVHGGSALLGGETTIYGTLNIPYLQSTSTTASYFTGSVGIGTTTPGVALAVNGPFLAQGTSTISGAGLITQALFSTSSLSFYTGVTGTQQLTIKEGGLVGIGTSSPGVMLALNGPFLAQGTSTISGAGLITQALFSTSSLSFYTGVTGTQQLTIKEGGLVGIGTSSPGSMLAVNGPGLFNGTSTILGGLNVESISATSSLGIYTRNTAAPRVVVDFSGNVGIATSGPATTLSTVGSGYFTGGLGVGYATTGSGNLLVNELAVVKGRVGVAATSSPYQELGVAGDVVLGGAIGTSTVSAETTTGSRGGCIELRGADGLWVSIYPASGSTATSTTATYISAANRLGAGMVETMLLVIERGRCEGGTD